MYTPANQFAADSRVEGSTVGIVRLDKAINVHWELVFETTIGAWRRRLLILESLTIMP